jgi:hypothetical protein
VYAAGEEESDDSKGRFYEQLGQVLDHFPMYHTKILFGDFNAKFGIEGIFKPTNGNKSLHQDSNDNGIRTGNSNLNNARHAASRHFRNKKKEYLEPKIDELELKVRSRLSETCIGVSVTV